MKNARKKKLSGDGLERKSFQPSGDWETKQGESISYAEVIWRNIDRFMSKTLGERLQELIEYLENRGSTTDKKLAGQMRGMAAKIETMDDAWEADGVASRMAKSVDWYIEEMLPRYIYSTLHQLGIEGLIASSWLPQQYQEYMRLALLPDEKKKQLDEIRSPIERKRQLDKLKKEMLSFTDDFLTQLHSRLIDAPRKQRNQIKHGGSESPLKEWAPMLCFHYERLRPIWRDAKKVYKQHGGDKDGRKAVNLKYHDLGAGEPWALKPEYIGLPEKLIDKLRYLKSEESRPDNLAYEHAAYLCGFMVGNCRARRNKQVYSIKQIKRVISEHKKKLGPDYYKALFKSERRWTISGDSQ
jgi:hypothetical protein